MSWNGNTKWLISVLTISAFVIGATVYLMASDAKAQNCADQNTVKIENIQDRLDRMEDKIDRIIEVIIPGKKK